VLSGIKLKGIALARERMACKGLIWIVWTEVKAQADRKVNDLLIPTIFRINQSSTYYME
jgi:hypothetical protein